MNLKSLLRAVATMLFFGTLSTALLANAASPDPSPAAGATTKHKASPDAIKAARLTRLKNQAGLTADQEAKAKPIIDKYVDDRQAANGDRAKLVSLKTQVRHRYRCDPDPGSTDETGSREERHCRQNEGRTREESGCLTFSGENELALDALPLAQGWPAKVTHWARPRSNCGLESSGFIRHSRKTLLPQPARRQF